MYICSCHAVTDGAIRAAIRSGVKTFAQLAKTTKISTNCHICGREAKRIFYEILREEQANPAIPNESGAVELKACTTPCGHAGGCDGCPALSFSHPENRKEK